MPEETEWPPYTKEEPKYYIYNAENIGTGKGPRSNPCAFWNDFLPKLQGNPIFEDQGCNGKAEETFSDMSRSSRLSHAIWFILLSSLAVILSL